MRRHVAGFDWDDGNWPKCGKHGVSRAEIEESFRIGPSIFANSEHSIIEQRLRAIARLSNGKYIYVSFTYREILGETYIRPISARYMHKKEIERYEQR